MRGWFFVVLIIWGSRLQAQDFIISDSGKQSQGIAIPDRLMDIPQNLWSNGKPSLIFKWFDANRDSILLGSEAINISDLFDHKAADSADYFILLNKGKSAIRFFLFDNRFTTVKQVNVKPDSWKPIEFSLRTRDYGSIKKYALQPGQCLIIKTARHGGTASGMQRMRLQTESNGVLVSEPYFAAYDPNELMLGHEFDKYRFFLKDRLSYLAD
jgi:hypothetical protein